MREKLMTYFLLAASGATLSACASQGLAASDNDQRVAAGARLFEVYCSSCHSTMPDAVVVGPSLAGVASKAGQRVEGMNPRDYLDSSIREPDAYLVDGYKDLMPGNFVQTLDPDEIEALIAYLLTLR